MALQFARLTRPKVDEHILRYAQDYREAEVRSVAISAVNDFASISATQIDESTFSTYVQSMAGKLDVAMPSVPADLSTLTDAQAVALADSLELADWDYRRRTQQVGENYRYWLRQKELGRTPPAAAAYIAMYLTLINYVRAKRGLAAVV